MPRKEKTKIIDPSKEKGKRERLIKKKRQEIAKALKKLCNTNKYCVEACKSLLDRPFRNIKDISPRHTRKCHSLFFPGRGTGPPPLWVHHSKSVIEVAERFGKFWQEYGTFIRAYLCHDSHIDELSDLDEENTAQWFNLEDVKSKEDLEGCWEFIRQWKTYMQTYRQLGWGEWSGTREQNTKTYYYMRHRGKELRAEGKNREQIYKTITKEVTQIFQYCPGVSYDENNEINIKYEAIQNASRFWHILGDKKYDSNEYKNLRATYTERDGKNKSIPLRNWYKREKSKLTKT